MERLVEELTPIEKWDTAYCQNSYTEVHEKIVFLARRERRGEILSQLSLLFSDWTYTPVNLQVKEPERKDRTERLSVSGA